MEILQTLLAGISVVTRMVEEAYKVEKRNKKIYISIQVKFTGHFGCEKAWNSTIQHTNGDT